MSRRFGQNTAGHYVTDRSEKPLTKRELEVLQCMAAGQTNREIATRLFLTEETIKTHVRHVIAKMGSAWNRTHAVSLAYQRGILDLTGAAVADVPVRVPPVAEPEPEDDHPFAGYLLP